MDQSERYTAVISEFGAQRLPEEVTNVLFDYFVDQQPSAQIGAQIISAQSDELSMSDLIKVSLESTNDDDIEGW